MLIPTDIRPASFRGVPFDAREAGYTGGRRLTVHEYPQRDEPGADDHGRATRRWRLQAFIVREGDETHAGLQARKRQVREACEGYGPGKLIHPTDGEIQARCETIEVSEGVSVGLQYVEFNLGFVEAGSAFTAIPVQSARASGFATAVRAAVARSYAIRRAARRIDNLTRRALSGDLADRANAAMGIVGLMSGVDMSAYQSAVSAAQDTNATMRDDAAATSTGWQDVVASFTDPRSAQTFVDTFLPGLVASQAAATAGSASPVAQACLDNRADLDLLIVVSAVSASAEVASAATYTAYDEAIATRDALATQIAAVAEYCVDPDTYASLMDLQAAASIAISDEAIELPRITTYEVTTPRTAIEIAHALYGDATRADEIVSRNRIADPNSVCGTLRVLVV